MTAPALLRQRFLAEQGYAYRIVDADDRVVLTFSIEG